MRERDVQLDDLTGTVDVSRYVFAASDLRANIKAMQLQRTCELAVTYGSVRYGFGA